MASPLENVTIETTAQPLTAQPLAPEPVVPVNEPEAATLPPPIPQLQAGEIPAVLVPPVTQELMSDPVIDALVTNFPKLGELGLEYYEASDLSSVIYNPSQVTAEQLAEADQNGTLGQIAQPLQSLEGSAGPGAAPDGMQAPLAAESLPVPPPAGEARLQSARVQNMAPRQISPIQPRPVTTGLAKRAI